MQMRRATAWAAASALSSGDVTDASAQNVSIMFFSIRRFIPPKAHNLPDARANMAKRDPGDTHGGSGRM